MSNILIKDVRLDKDILVNIINLKGIGKLEDIYNFRIDENNRFLDDEWDFSDNNKEKRDDGMYKYKFESIKKEFRIYVKILVVQEFLGRKNISTVSKTFQIAKTIINDLYKKNVVDPRLISLETIKEYIEDKEAKGEESYVEVLCIKLEKLLSVIEEYIGINFQAINTFLREKGRIYRKNRATSSVNEYIPDDFYNMIVSLAIKDSQNEVYKKEYRIFCCLLIILAETGMRIESLIGLESNALDLIETPKGKVSYLNFYTNKVGDNRERLTYCYLSEIGKEAYMRAELLSGEIIDNLTDNTKYKVYKKIIEDNGEVLPKEVIKYKDLIAIKSKEELELIRDKAKRFLFISRLTGEKINKTNSAREYLYRFSIIHYNEFRKVQLTNEERKRLNLLKIEKWSRYDKYCNKEFKDKISFEEIKNMEFPYANFHMFRVTVCTKLFRMKVPIDYIVNHMNHLEEDMSLYYHKSEVYKNELEESMEIIYAMANESGEIDENKLEVKHKKKIAQINKFLRKNKLNVWKDASKVYELAKKNNGTLAENEFGMCIRTVMSAYCKKRNLFSSVDKVYNDSIHINTYRHIDYTYERFQQKKQIIRHNLAIAKNDEELLLDVQREENSLKYFIKNRMSKELNLLEIDIKIRGEKGILEEYPYLNEIIQKVNIIKGEIEEWI